MAGGQWQSEGVVQRGFGYIEIGRQECGEPACGGRRLTDGEMVRGYFVEPTVFAGVTEAHTIAREEIFGPVLAILRAAEEARRVVFQERQLLEEEASARAAAGAIAKLQRGGMNVGPTERMVLLSPAGSAGCDPGQSGRRSVISRPNKQHTRTTKIRKVISKRAYRLTTRVRCVPVP